MYNSDTTFVIANKLEYLWLMEHLGALGYCWNSGHKATHYNYNRDYYTQKRLYIIGVGRISCGYSGKNEVLVSSLMNFKRPSIFKSTLSSPKIVDGYKVSPEFIDLGRSRRWE